MPDGGVEGARLGMAASGACLVLDGSAWAYAWGPGGRCAWALGGRARTGGWALATSPHWAGPRLASGGGHGRRREQVARRDRGALGRSAETAEATQREGGTEGRRQEVGVIEQGDETTPVDRENRNSHAPTSVAELTT